MLMAFLLMQAIGSTAFAEPVRVRAAVHGDSGRMAFNWDFPVSYSASISGNQLVVSFDRPIEADLSIITRALSGYVTAGAIDSDGQTVRLTLTKQFELVHFPAGSAIVVDLVGAPGQPETEEAQTGQVEAESVQAEQVQADQVQAEQVEAVQEAAAEPVTESVSTAETVQTVQDQVVSQVAVEQQDTSGLPEVTIRTGRHADKLRLVFDWPERVGYRVERQGNIARVTFDEPVRISVEELGSIMPEVVGDARSRVSGGQTVVSLAIAEGARLRDFYAGNKMVLDAYSPTDGSTASKLPPLPGTQTVAAPAEPEGQVSVAATETQPSETAELEEAVSSEQLAQQAVALEQEAQQQLADQPGESAQDEQTQEQPIEQKPDEPVDLTPAEETADAAGADVQAVSQGTITTGGTATDTGFSLNFAWDEPVAAAVFRRGGALWMVFDKPAEVDVAAMRAVAGDSILDLVQLQHPLATIIRAVTERGINPIPRREGMTWIMDFAEQSLSTLSPVEAAAQPDSPVGARVFLPVPDPGKALPVTDPEMGDNFIVIPVLPLGYGITNYYQYPQFRIRPSSQGLVVEPTIDTLRVRPARQGVGITSTRTLHLSPVSEEDIAKAQTDSARDMSRIVDLEPLKGVGIDLYTESRQGLEREVAFAKTDEERTNARLELIRFYLAHGMSAEALGVSRVLADDIPDVKKRADFRLYRGMANFFMARYADAKIDLEGPQLDGNDEGIFWRSLVDLALGDDDPITHRGVLSTSSIPDPYPRSMRIPLSFWIADAAVRAADTNRAKEVLEKLNAEELTGAEQSKVTYFLGLNNEAMGDFEEAIFNWEQAMQGEDPFSAVHATLARAELLMKMERISRLEGVEELEKLRFAWRGGDFEFNLLRRLGTLYLRMGGFREGLRTLRQAATYFREREEAQQVTQLMSDAFAALFLRGEADRMAPVSAIALYEEFKELTPVADLGNEMIRKLADRLVGVDLLTDAAELLDDQIQFRLDGVEKARVGAQLAVVRILAKDYAGAIEALDGSQAENLDPELITQRRHLRSRALMGTGETITALSLIEDDLSLEAEKLRTEAYWSMGDWVRTAKSLRELVKASGASPDQELSQEQALHILNYAIALTLGGNDRALLQLRQDYRQAMEQADFGDAFTLIATPEEFGLIKYETIAARVRVAEKFRDFMTSYKQRLKESALSSIN